MDQDQFDAMTFNHPAHIPVGVGLLGATWKKYREALDELVARHPAIFGETEPGMRDYDAIHHRRHIGGHWTDEWGCGWSNIREGMAGVVTDHPIPTREAVHEYEPPEAGAGIPHGFMYLRLVDLRGYQEIMMDFAEEPPELQMLIDMVLEYNVGELDRALQDPPQMMHFGDDLGLQGALPIHPEKWRTYLKPCFAKMFGMCKDAGCYVYLHTDGHIVPIIKDLIECGVDVLNPQLSANGLGNLEREAKGKVCINLDLNRQKFPFWTPEEIDEHIREAVEALGSPEGGLWLRAECVPDVPLENIEAICKALERYRSYYSDAA